MYIQRLVHIKIAWQCNQIPCSMTWLMYNWHWPDCHLKRCLKTWSRIHMEHGRIQVSYIVSDTYIILVVTYLEENARIWRLFRSLADCLYNKEPLQVIQAKAKFMVNKRQRKFTFTLLIGNRTLFILGVGYMFSKYCVIIDINVWQRRRLEREE